MNYIRRLHSSLNLGPAFTGLLLTFSFAPFHLPGFAIISLGLLFLQLSSISNSDKIGKKRAFQIGFSYGFAFMMTGVSWVYVSIHEYGHLNFILSGLLTFLFVLYLALFPGFFALCYYNLKSQKTEKLCCLLFSGLWCLHEYLRSTLFTGFPWLLVGFGQLDSPLKYLLPIIGVYGVSFVTSLSACCFAVALQQKAKLPALRWILCALTLVLGPLTLSFHSWVSEEKPSISVGVIQANLSMHDKWDEAIFWSLVQHYKENSEKADEE